MKQLSPHTTVTLAHKYGVNTPTISAVFEVEAAGKFFNSNGSIPARFEPHHFPRKYWGHIGFDPAGQTPWRASLKIPTSRRNAMFETASKISAEAAAEATSWAAPQIMGFNYKLAGYRSALEMVAAFRKSADEQVRGFFTFVENAGLMDYLRSQNWLAFASGYNGNGQAPVYAAKIERAYRRHSGQPSNPTLRLGSRGDAVAALQSALGVTIDAHYGAETAGAVRQFQRQHGLTVDGVAGPATLRKVDEVKGSREWGASEQKSTTDLTWDSVWEKGGVVLGGGGVGSALAVLNENSQTILIGGLVVAALVFFGIRMWRKR